jgi:hypothetical protein
MSNIIKNMTKISKNPNIEKWFCHSDRRPKKKRLKSSKYMKWYYYHTSNFFFDTFWVLKLHKKINKSVLKTVINLVKDEFAMPLISWPCKK